MAEAETEITHDNHATFLTVSASNNHVNMLTSCYTFVVGVLWTQCNINPKEIHFRIRR